MKKNRLKSRAPAFSLVETIFYIALLSLLSVSIIATVLLLVRSAGHIRMARAVQTDAVSALSRVTFEVRRARDISDGASVFNAHPGVLTIESTNDDGSSKTISFSLLGSSLYASENGVFIGPLTSSSTAINSLIFRKIQTPRSLGVKIEMKISEEISATSTDSFYSTVLLRNSY